MDLHSFFNTYTKRIETYLATLLDSFSPLENIQHQLNQAVQYSVLNGGKRLRPLLIYATGMSLGALPDQLDAPASAIELIHCYSLVHDDLPAMDDDSLRRGKPTCHKAFDEATAILVGDALQSLAFQILSDPKLNSINAEQQILMINTLSKASGIQGMVGGQALDMASENKKSLTLEELCLLHEKKTGALIQTSIHLGAIAAGCQDSVNLNALDEYARLIGLAYQIQDDILDVTGDSKLLGKNTGMDAIHNKTTFPSVLGLEKAIEYAKDLSHQAIKIIERLSHNDSILSEMAQYVVTRQI